MTLNRLFCGRFMIDKRSSLKKDHEPNDRLKIQRSITLLWLEIWILIYLTTNFDVYHHEFEEKTLCFTCNMPGDRYAKEQSSTELNWTEHKIMYIEVEKRKHFYVRETLKWMGNMYSEGNDGYKRCK